MPSVGWSGVKHTAAGHWSSGNMFCEVMNDAPLSGRLMNASGFSQCQENVTCLSVFCGLAQAESSRESPCFKRCRYSLEGAGGGGGSPGKNVYR